MRPHLRLTHSEYYRDSNNRNIDIPALATQLREKDELITLQSQQIATLENTITSMEEKYTQIIDIPDSIIFTKKAHQEHKIPTIVQALQKSIIGRKDKTRALVQELQSWQKDNYIDPHYNAQVMFDELQKIIPLPFGYEVFKKHYNNTRY